MLLLILVYGLNQRNKTKFQLKQKQLAKKEWLENVRTKNLAENNHQQKCHPIAEKLKILTHKSLKQ